MDESEVLVLLHVQLDSYLLFLEWDAGIMEMWMMDDGNIHIAFVVVAGVRYTRVYEPKGMSREWKSLKSVYALLASGEKM